MCHFLANYNCRVSDNKISETNGHHEISHACAVVALTSFCAFMFFELRTSRIELFPDTGATQRRKLAKVSVLLISINRRLAYAIDLGDICTGAWA